MFYNTFIAIPNGSPEKVFSNEDLFFMGCTNCYIAQWFSVLGLLLSYLMRYFEGNEAVFWNKSFAL